MTWAREEGATIVFDAAYEAFVRDESLPRSIYEVSGAEECAIEMRSFSKRAGFTGVRCAYTVVPRALRGRTSSGERVPLQPLWARRHATKFNGVSYVVQRAAAAVYSEAGRRETARQIDFYMDNAERLRSGLEGAGFKVHGGKKCPLHLARDPRRELELGIFWRAPRESPDRRNSGLWFWPRRRRLFSPLRLQLARERR